VRSGLLLLVGLLLAACGSVPASRTETYRCSGGRTFSLALEAPGGPRLAWDGMEFPVSAQAGMPGVYACEVLTLWRDGRSAWLDVQGQPGLRECSRVD
jgi:hypothetical protein